MSGIDDPGLNALLEGMRDRFALIDRQLVGLQADIEGYGARRRATEQPAAPAPVAPIDRRPIDVAPPPPRRPPAAPVPPRPPSWGTDPVGMFAAAVRRWRGELALSDFLGLRALAWIGGVITLLGIAFFYVLADQRGWVGPGGRVLLGTSISCGLIGLAHWLRHLKGQPEGALVVAGTGIAGLWVTLFAASKLYGYVPDAGAMPLALGIAALAVVIARRWSAEPLALLGLVGACVAPPLVEGGVSTIGVAFAGIVAAASMVLWIDRRWDWTALAVAAVATPQLVALVLDQPRIVPAIGWNAPWQTVLLCVAFWAIYLTAGFVRQMAAAGRDQAAMSIFVTTSASAIAASAVLFSGSERGAAMIVVAAVYGGLAYLPTLLGRPDRDLSSLFAATALTAALAATGELMHGAPRSLAVSAEAALLVWTAHRFREMRFQVASLAYLALATVLALVQAPLVNLVAFPPIRITDASGGLDTGLVLAGILSASGLALAVGAFALWSRPLLMGRRDWQRTVYGAALGTGLYAAAQAILSGFISFQYTQRSFENGHTLVSLVVALVGVGLLVLGLRRRSTDARTAGMILLGAAVAKLFLYDLEQLNLMARAVAFIAVGLLLLAGGVVYQRLWEAEITVAQPAPGH